jgi:hypothetical protein
MDKTITVTRKGANITVPLPDFKDDIAFKMSGQPGVSTAPATDTPALATTDPIAGQWRGSISGEGGFGTPIELTVKPGCQVGRVCGTVSVPELPCSGDLALTGIRGSTFTFIEQNMGGSESCVSGGTELLTLQADGTLLFQYTITLASGQKLASSGVLMKSPD